MFSWQDSNLYPIFSIKKMPMIKKTIQKQWSEKNIFMRRTDYEFKIY